VRELGFDPMLDDHDRRVVTSAVVNCLEQEENLKGRKNIKIAAWYLMFLTEPAGYEPDKYLTTSLPADFYDNQNIFLEVIRKIDMDKDKAIAHEIVQLYR
jgi:hypothetical protein